MKLKIFAVLTLLIFDLSLSLTAQATTITNELGDPQAGGLPREQSSSYEILYGSVRVGNDIQRVIVTNPPGTAPKPALLFVGGMGCYSLDFSGTGPKVTSYQRILDFVTRLGFVTMRVEKTGMGDSVGTPCELQDFHREVQGNLAGLKALVSYPFVKADQVYIFGHSIGGVIAPFLSQQVPVKGVAVIGSLAGNWYSYELTNTRRQLTLSGMAVPLIQSEMAKKKIMADEFFLNKKSPDQIRREHPEVADYLQMMVHWTYMQQLSEVDPQQDWNRSNTSVLILSGTSDFIGSQVNELSSMVQQANKSRSTPMRLLQIQQIDHFFLNAESQQASFNSKHLDGSDLDFQESFLTTLQKEFLAR